MILNEYNAAIARRLLTNIAKYEHGETGIGEIQGDLDGSMGLVENDGSGLSRLIAVAEADLETIRFSVQDSRQPEVAWATLDRLREQLESLLELG